MSISKEKQEEIISKIKEALEKKGKKIKCPVCSHENLILIEGYTKNALQDEIEGGLRIGGPSIPSAVVVCENCGNTLQFNLGVLGFLKKKNGE